MTVVHDFSAPRNLFEKLLRDSERLNRELSGDSIFNFVSTAFHLQHWIKHSPLISSEVVKRLLKRIGGDENIKLCQAIARADRHFKVEITGESSIIRVGDDEVNLDDFRKNVIQLYSNYFSVK